MVYLIAFIAALTAAFLNDRLTPKLRNSILIIIFIYIVIILGFRYKVGIDTISYMNSYRNIPTLDKLFSENIFTINRYEPGFNIVCSICRTITTEFWLLQLVMAAITNGCIFLFLHRYCKNVFIGVLLYFIFSFLYFSTEILRESAAVGIFLINYKNLQEKKWINYYMLSLLSIAFHYSAIIIWFFPFAKFLKPNLFFCVLCVIFIAITPLVERLNEFLHIASIYNRIDLYASGANDLNMNWRIGEMIRTAFPTIATIIGYNIIKKKCEFNDMLLLQILFCMGAFAIPLIFSRFSNYTSLFIVAAASNLISSNSLNKGLKILFISFILLTQVNYYYVNYNRWIPYVSIFYPEDLPYRTDLYRHGFLPWLRFYRGW